MPGWRPEGAKNVLGTSCYHQRLNISRSQDVPRRTFLPGGGIGSTQYFLSRPEQSWSQLDPKQKAAIEWTIFKMPNSAFLDLHLRFRLEPVTDANRLPCFLCVDSRRIRKLFSVVPRRTWKRHNSVASQGLIIAWSDDSSVPNAQKGQ